MESRELLQSSRRWTAIGLAAFPPGGHSHDFAVHHIGIALEHLLKSYLASLHPALVVDPKDFDSMLHATGHGNRAKRPVTPTKTIGLAAAFQGVKRLLPKQITVSEPQFEPVLAARNGIAHAATHDRDEVRDVLTTFVRVVDPVLAELGQDPGQYWGDFLALHDQLVDDHASELKVAFAAKVARAKDAYTRRIQGLVSQKRIQIVAALSAANPYSSDHDHPVGCPACEGRGWLHGITDVDWGGIDEDGAPSPMVVFYADAYDCALCGLHLENDELDLAGLDTEIELPDEEPYADYEPDEDLWRGR
ncbi:hypothetical protein [Alloactinosynnema sp. L-07]|nr:hypothetical protein [Alloactinosynnema sp. L-07]